MRKVNILDKEFKLSIPSASIKRAVEEIASRINNDYAGEEVLFVSVLNGAFVFSADLIQKIKIDCQITFIKLASYEGTSSTGEVKKLIGLNEDIKDRHVIVLEDIVESGTTLDNTMKQLKTMNPASIKLATLLFKPQSFQRNMKIDYVGLEIPNDFIVGYGLDYNGYGRNLENIYSLIN
ncbi:MAG: hypoxanthine phosphoribosyltransferase [Bacteroidota bacterium]|nr:hypoxanthine phosphoribosyltransferase [Bacteroidota bacterium]